MSAFDPKRTSDDAVVFSVLKVWRDRERDVHDLCHRRVAHPIEMAEKVLAAARKTVAATVKEEAAHLMTCTRA
jgi:hypothetical protein